MVDQLNKSNKLLKLTDFERRVLEFTDKIPKGKISTYQFVARAMGKPKAVRAVGNALNKNPLMIVIPCHRVVRSDGDIGGFGAGVFKKRQLLLREGIDFNENNKVRNLEIFLYKF